jgi:hypothetical protein
MVSCVPPYPPPPRHAPDDLGRRAEAPRLIRAAGIAVHLLGIFLFALVPLATAAVALMLLFDEQSPLIVRTCGFVVCTMIAIAGLKSLLPRRLPLRPRSIPVSLDDQPTAFAFVRLVAADVGMSAPIQLFIGSGTELLLVGRRSLLDLIRTPRWELHVGLWLWQVLTLSELQALIARTLAPAAGGRLDKFRSTARTLLEALTDGRDHIDEVAAESNAVMARWATGTDRMFLSPIRLIARLLLRFDPAVHDSRSDDLSAVRVAGSDALVIAILRSDLAAAALREMDEILLRASVAGIWTSDLYEHVADGIRAVREAHNDYTVGEPPVLRGPTAGKHTEVFEPGQRYLSKLWADFPPPDEREQNAKLDFVAAERDDRPAAELIQGPTTLRERSTVLHYVEVLETAATYLPVPPMTVRRWLNAKPENPFPGKYAGCYDGGRTIEPGTDAELLEALASDAWDDARLRFTAGSLYATAAERATTWRTARMTLERLLQKTVYHPIGRYRAQAEDLEDDLRKSTRWLAALDRWVYVIHVHMAARLPDLGRHEAIMARYESVLQFQPFVAEARKLRNRVAAFTRRLSAEDGHTPHRLGRDAAQEFAIARRELEALLSEAEAIRDPQLREWTGDIPLDRFLLSHQTRPPTRARGTHRYGLMLLDAWDEFLGKARWLHRVGIGALLELHESIEREFAAGLSADLALSDDPTAIGPAPLAVFDEADIGELEPAEAHAQDDTAELPPDPADRPWFQDDHWAGAE